MGIVRLPALCKNQHCGEVFLSSWQISIEGGGGATVNRMNTGPCPKCGGSGTIPNGTYKNVGNVTGFTPQSASDRLIYEAAMRLIREAIRVDMPPEEFRKNAVKAAPELSVLWRLLPTDQAGAYQFWTLVLLVIGTVLAGYAIVREGEAPQIALPESVTEALESALRQIRDENRR